VKLAWGKKVATAQQHDQYRELRARMTLRKELGCEPDEEEIKAESLAISVKGYKGSLSVEDVIKGFERGEEVGFYRLIALKV